MSDFLFSVSLTYDKGCIKWGRLVYLLKTLIQPWKMERKFNYILKWTFFLFFDWFEYFVYQLNIDNFYHKYNICQFSSKTQQIKISNEKRRKKAAELTQWKIIQRATIVYFIHFEHRIWWIWILTKKKRKRKKRNEEND